MVLLHAADGNVWRVAQGPCRWWGMGGSPLRRRRTSPRCGARPAGDRERDVSQTSPWADTVPTLIFTMGASPTRSTGRKFGAIASPWTRAVAVNLPGNTWRLPRPSR